MNARANQKILIVDDESALREVIASIVQMQGFSTLQAKNGAEAFEMLKRENDIDLVLSDVRMPVLDGIKLLSLIKEHNHEKPIVMIMTGFSDVAVDELYHLGAHALLEKPFDLKVLSQTIARALSEEGAMQNMSPQEKSALFQLRCEFPQMQDALTKGFFALARGGMFLQLKHNFPPQGSLVAFDTAFHNEPQFHLQGIGMVRWVRESVRDGLPQGCGIEFMSLEPETKARVSSILHGISAKTVAFIPKA